MTRQITTKSLVKFNLIMAALHAVQVVAVLLLSSPKHGVWQVTANYLTLGANSTVNKPQLVSATHDLFAINLAYVVAAFFLMSTLAHLFVVTFYRRRYETNLNEALTRSDGLNTL